MENYFNAVTQEEVNFQISVLSSEELEDLIESDLLTLDDHKAIQYYLNREISYDKTYFSNR